jgi:hypothetical protein
MLPLVPYLAVASSILILAGCLVRATRFFAPWEPDVQGPVIGYPRLFRFIGLAGGAMPLVALVIAVFAPLENPGDVAAFVGIVALFTLLAALTILESGMRIVLADSFVWSFAAWRGVRSMPWSSVQGVSYWPRAGWLVLRGTDGTVVRLAAPLTSAWEVVNELRRRLPPELLVEAEQEIRRVMELRARYTSSPLSGDIASQQEPDAQWPPNRPGPPSHPEDNAGASINGS